MPKAASAAASTLSSAIDAGDEMTRSIQDRRNGGGEVAGSWGVS